MAHSERSGGGGSAEVQVADNRDERRYEALVDGEVAGVLFYRERDGNLVLVHTEVRDGWEGHGIGSRLVSGTLDAAREQGVRVVPVCRFVRSYLRRHPEYADVLAE